ncbi:MAG: N-acetylmuramoyl-L-alanine amidase [Prevotella sp.]|nr:N-acetylmuramoyl-L-alanine amidase [Prevotella sp.]
MTVVRIGSRGSEVKRLQQLLCDNGYGVIADGIFGSITQEMVKAFQRDKGLFPDGIVGDKTWRALMPGLEASLKRSRRRIDLILVHCTATPEGRDMTVEQIRAQHMLPVERGGLGASDIGYHYVIYRDGSIHNGRDVDLAGAHCAGFNSFSIGVTYVGGVENIPGVPYARLKAKDTRTPEQKVALVNLLQNLRRLYPNAEISGHRNYDRKGKPCPSFDARTEYRDI